MTIACQHAGSRLSTLFPVDMQCRAATCLRIVTWFWAAVKLIQTGKSSNAKLCLCTARLACVSVSTLPCLQIVYNAGWPWHALSRRRPVSQRSAPDSRRRLNIVLPLPRCQFAAGIHSSLFSSTRQQAFHACNSAARNT